MASDRTELTQWPVDGRGHDRRRTWRARRTSGHVTEVLDHHGDTIVRGADDGAFDKSALPDELVLSNYFSVRDGRIVSLVVVRDEPAASFSLVVVRDEPAAS